MKIDRFTNAKRIIATGLINRLVSLFFPFVVRTVFLNTLGAKSLGLNSLFVSILQVLNLTELGIGSAIIYSMYKPIAEDNVEEISSLLNFYRKVYRIVGLILIGLGILTLPFLSKFVGDSNIDGANIHIIFMIMLVNTSISYIFYGYTTSLIIAFQRKNIINNINTAITICLSILQIITLYTLSHTLAFYLFVALTMVSTMVTNILYKAYTIRYFPQYSCRGKIDSEHISKIKTQVLGLFINKVCQMTRNSLDNVFVNLYLGLVVTAMYSNYYYVFFAVVSIMSVISTSIVAGIGHSIASENMEKNYDDMNKFNFIYMWISGWFTVCMLCLYQPFMRIWVGERLMFPMVTVILFCVYFYALMMGDLRAVYSDAAGLWWHNRYRAAAESVLNLVLNIVLGKLLGVSGIILGTLISLVIINFGFGSGIVFRKYFVGKSLGKYFIDHLLYFVATAVVAVVTYFISVLPGENGYKNFILKVLICTVIPNILYLIFYFRTNRFRNVINWIVTKQK